MHRKLQVKSLIRHSLRTRDTHRSDYVGGNLSSPLRVTNRWIGGVFPVDYLARRKAKVGSVAWMGAGPFGCPAEWARLLEPRRLRIRRFVLPLGIKSRTAPGGNRTRTTFRSTDFKS